MRIGLSPAHALRRRRTNIISPHGTRRVSQVLKKATPDTSLEATALAAIGSGISPGVAPPDVIVPLHSPLHSPLHETGLVASQQRLEERVATLQADVTRILELLSDHRRSSRELTT